MWIPELLQIVGRDERGFTLIEVGVTILVGILALFAIMTANTIVQKTSASSHERVIALQDAHRVVERIRENATYGGFPDNVVSAFPSGQPVTGFQNLESEQVTVSYPSASDPLDISVTVNWQDYEGRALSYVLNTLVTQRE